MSNPLIGRNLSILYMVNAMDKFLLMNPNVVALYTR